jgi:hypothetical protein
VHVVPQRHDVHCWEGSQEVALWKDNLVGKFNDDQIQAMVAAYGFAAESTRA